MKKYQMSIYCKVGMLSTAISIMATLIAYIITFF